MSVYILSDCAALAASLIDIIMKYLKSTIDLKLTFNKSFDAKITGYSNADWANDPSDRKSIIDQLHFMLSTTAFLDSIRNKEL